MLDGADLLDPTTLTPEEAAQRKQAEVAAKRAEVEANVRKALADRSKS